MKNIFKLTNITNIFLTLFITVNLISMSGTFTKNEPNYWRDNQKIDLIEDAKTKIQQKLETEKDIHMIKCSYELKGNKLQSTQTKVFHTSYRKDPSYDCEEFPLTSNDKNLKNARVEFIFNKCTDDKIIIQKIKHKKNQTIAFNTKPQKATPEHA